MTYYAATVRVLVNGDNHLEAGDILSDSLRPLLQNFTPGSSIVDWKYLSNWHTSTGEGFKYGPRFRASGPGLPMHTEATGWLAPYFVFDAETRTYMPQPYHTQAGAQHVADRLNKHGLDAYRWTCNGADEGLDGMRARVLSTVDSVSCSVPCVILEFIDGSRLEVNFDQLCEHTAPGLARETMPVAQGPEGNGHDLPTCRACGHPGSDEHTGCPTCNVCDDTSQNTYTVVLTRDVTESCFVTVEATSIEEAKRQVWDVRHNLTFEVDDNPPRDAYISDAWVED